MCPHFYLSSLCLHLQRPSPAPSPAQLSRQSGVSLRHAAGRDVSLGAVLWAPGCSLAADLILPSSRR
ncbi:hypothetical protein JB92DRAFT_2993040 [Gautieria morchelliformis]|nr:hypothetical protein JB92DRAFT_2993040 [Gautieria morchelliformis]